MSDDEEQISSNANEGDIEQGKSLEGRVARKKIIGVLTVIAYLISVSMAAIMLSLYYIFIWNPSLPSTSPRTADPPGKISNSTVSIRSKDNYDVEKGLVERQA